MERFLIVFPRILLRRRYLVPLAATVVAFVAAWLVIHPWRAVGADTAADDTPPVPAHIKSIEPDEDLRGQMFAQDAYYSERRLAGDTPLSFEQSGQFRSVAEDATRTLRSSRPVSTSFAAWTPAGPNPIVQIGRTSGGAEAVSGRIGALAIQPGTGRLILGAAQGGIWTYDTAAGVWVPRTDNLSVLSIGALKVAPSNPNIVYAGTGEGALSGDSYFGNGVLKSTDGGTTWANVSGNAFKGVSSAGIAIDPTNANHVYLAVGRGRGGARRVTPPTSTVYGVYESTDGGVHWRVLKGTTDENHGATDIEVDPVNPNILYASFWADAMYKSTNGGRTWSPIMGGLPAGADYVTGATRFSIGLSHPAGQSAVLYTGFDYYDASGKYHPSGLWKSTNEGGSWSLLPGGSGVDTITDYCGTQCFYDNVVEVDPTNANIVYIAGSYNYGIGSGGIYRSTDGGQTWKSLGYDLHPDFHAIAIQPDHPSNVLIGNDGGVWYSTTSGGRNNPGDKLSAADWQDLNGTVDPATAAVLHRTNLNITQFTSVANNPAIPGRLWGGSQDNGTERRSTGAGNTDTWFDVGSGDGGQVLVDPNNGNFTFGTFFGISPYRFSGAAPDFFTNQSITRGINTGERSEFYIPWVMNQANPNQLFLGTYRLYRTNNAEAPRAGDVTWTPISPDLTSGCTGTAPNGARGCLLSAVGMAEGGDGVYTGSDDGLVYVSPNAVTSNSPTWTRVGKTALPARPVTGFAVDRSNWRTAYISYAGYNAATRSRPGHIFATSDGGASWADISGNLPDAPVNSVVLDPATPGTLYAATDVGTFVTKDGGAHWGPLSSGMPIVSVWTLDFDPSHRQLAAATHGRGAYTTTDPTARPALVESTSDTGVPVGPGSNVDYTIKVRNVGNTDATGVTVTDPLPANTSFVSASNGGSQARGAVNWSGLTVPAGGSVSLSLTLRISPSLKSSVTAIVNDHISVNSTQHAGTSSSPHATPIAPAHAAALTPAAQTDGARTGQSVDYQIHLGNASFNADSYTLSAAGGFPATVLDATCTSPLTTTPTVASGASTDFCVRVSVPDGTPNAATNRTTVTATSVGDPTASGSATVDTIPVAVDTLLVDGDNGAPDTSSFYKQALTDSGTPFSYWDLGTASSLPQHYLNAFKHVVWFTGQSYPGPMLPYETELAAYLDGGGHLFLSGDDLLDQNAGTTAFVHNYLHVNWDGSETQNDRATSNVNGVAGSAVSDGIGSVPLDLALFDGNQFSDEITPIAPAAPAFTDDAGQTDGLSVDSGTYKVVFVAFPFEEYGTAAQRADFITRVLTYFG
ncbi:MAG: DUF11 domain-containing protein [Micromonosporaceae bacterium]|nr:DUF11 domain-containing protein [Micromonosporaceae bacterium]